MTYAQKADIVTELMMRGFLCDCTEHEAIYDADGEFVEKVIVHTSDCARIEKGRELINSTDTDWHMYELEES